MADDVQGLGEVVDELVAVAKDHLLRVPVGIAVVGAEVDSADEVEALVVDGVAVEDLGVKVKGIAEVIEAFLDGVVLGRGGRLAFLEDEFAGQEIVVLVVVGVVDLAVEVGPRRLLGRRLLLRQPLLLPLFGRGLLVLEGALGAFAGFVVDLGGLRELAEELVRDDAAARRVLGAGRGLAGGGGGQRTTSGVELSDVGQGVIAGGLGLLWDLAGCSHVFKDVGWHDAADVAAAAGGLGAHVSGVCA